MRGRDGPARLSCFQQREDSARRKDYPYNREEQNGLAPLQGDKSKRAPPGRAGCCRAGGEAPFGASQRSGAHSPEQRVGSQAEPGASGLCKAPLGATALRRAALLTRTKPGGPLRAATRGPPRFPCALRRDGLQRHRARPVCVTPTAAPGRSRPAERGSERSQSAPLIPGCEGCPTVRQGWAVCSAPRAAGGQRLKAQTSL